MSYEEKLSHIKEVLGDRWLLHPNYKPLPYHNTAYNKSHFLGMVREKAIQEGRLPA